jgi:hypothetical protein
MLCSQRIHLAFMVWLIELIVIVNLCMELEGWVSEVANQRDRHEPI